MTEPWIAFLAAMAEPDQPQALFVALETMVRDTVGARLFTVTLTDPQAGEVWRAYSSDPVAYPLSGRKPLTDDRWSEIVMVGHEPFVANSLAEIAELFPDHELIGALGCGSVVNVPVVFAGAVIGTLNLLDRAGHYTPERVARAMDLRPFAAIAVMAAMAKA